MSRMVEFRGSRPLTHKMLFFYTWMASIVLFFYTQESKSLRLEVRMMRLLIALTLFRAQLTGGASISGIVVHAGANEPLEGARVTLTAVPTSAAAGPTSPVVAGVSSGLPAEATLVAVSSRWP